MITSGSCLEIYFEVKLVSWYSHARVATHGSLRCLERLFLLLRLLPLWLAWLKITPHDYHENTRMDSSHTAALIKKEYPGLLHVSKRSHAATWDPLQAHHHQSNGRIRFAWCPQDNQNSSVFAGDALVWRVRHLCHLWTNSLILLNPEKDHPFFSVFHHSLFSIPNKIGYVREDWLIMAN